MKSEFWVRQNKVRKDNENKRRNKSWVIIAAFSIYISLVVYIFKGRTHSITENITFLAIVVPFVCFLFGCIIDLDKHDYNKRIYKDSTKKEVEKINKTVCLFKMAITEIDSNNKRIINNMDICKDIYTIVINDYISNYYINEEIVINMQNLYIAYNEKLASDKIDEISNKVNLLIIVETNKLKSILKDYLNNKY